MTSEFLSDLYEEDGFKFGSPWRYSDKALGVVVPILKERDSNGNLEERTYITIEEARNQGVTFKDTGKIDRVIFESSLQEPIFIRSGTMLKSSGTQPRAVESSVVIIPQEDTKGGIKEKEIPPIPIITRQEINVRCIYASKTIRQNERFTYGGDSPLEVRSALLSKRGQGYTWNAVDRTHRFMASRIRSYGLGTMHHSQDNLVGIMEEVDNFTKDVDDILKKIPLFEDQVGAVFLDIKDIVGLEMFDHPKSWSEIHKEVEKRLGESVAKEEEKTFFKPDYDKVKPLIYSFIKKLIEGEKEEISNGKTSTVTIRGNGVIGEATTINGKVIHLVGLKDEKTDKLEVAQTRQSNVFRSFRFGGFAQH